MEFGNPSCIGCHLTAEREVTDMLKNAVVGRCDKVTITCTLESNQARHASVTLITYSFIHP